MSKRISIGKMNKRGVFYTMMFTLLSAALISIAALFIQHSTSAESRNTELSFTQRIVDIDTSIQQVFAEAIRTRNTTHAVATNRSFTVYERIPTDFDALDDNIIANLRTSINSDIRIANVSTHIYNATHSVILQPINITYEHYSDSHVRIVPNFAVTGYNITLRANGIISACSKGTTAGGLTFEVYSLGGGSNCTLASEGAQTGSVSFQVSGGQIEVTLNASGQVNIESGVEIKSELTTYFGEVTSAPYVEVPIIVFITDQSFDFVKESNVRVW